MRGAGAIGCSTLGRQTEMALMFRRCVLLCLDAGYGHFHCALTPYKPQGFDLAFHVLTVTTAGNASDDGAAGRLLVKAIKDINAFLGGAPDTPKVPLASQHHFVVAIGTVEGLGKLASPQEPALVSDAPVCRHFETDHQLYMIGRDGTSARTQDLPVSQQQGSWSAQVGSAAAEFFTAALSGLLSKSAGEFSDIPALNQDDPVRTVQ